MEDLIKQARDRNEYNIKNNALQKKYERLVSNLNLIIPKHRTRRGLINGLGTVIKSITGNLDHDDYIEIHNQLQILEANQRNVNDQVTKQIAINQGMIERFNNISRHINEQQGTLQNYIDKLQSNLSNVFDRIDATLTFNQYFDQLIYNIDLLNEHLKEILESVTLAKLNVISKSILHPDEIRYIHEILKEQKVNIVSDENIYELLELQAYYNGSYIIFLIKIPSFYPESFHFYHLKELPMNNTHTIKLNESFLLLNNNEYQYMDKPCPVIENTRYCQMTRIREIGTDQCIPNLINSIKAFCDLMEKQNEELIELLEPNYLFINSQNKIPFETTCSPNFKTKTLKGIFLVQFENCTITMNGITYTSKTTLYWDSVEIIPTIHNKINKTKIIEKLTLQKLNDWTMENINSINLLNARTEKSINQSYITFAVLGLIITIYIIYKVKVIRILRKEHSNQPQVVIAQPQTESPAPIPLMWPSLHLKEGGVTSRSSKRTI